MKTTLVVTSIASPNKVLKSFAEGCKRHNIDFILIGDHKSPAEFEIDGCEFYSISSQKKLPFHLAQNLPENHYARKNIGYLIAIKNKSAVIIESDDDNFPMASFWSERKPTKQGYSVKAKGWVNVYKYFTEENIWPRGFELTEILKDHPKLESEQSSEKYSPIQQGLANDNPDVDAIYRLTYKLPVNFRKEKKDIFLPSLSWCPFNSQNTTWFKEAFPLLYLPSYCSFRMTDIWRSFIAQRIAWTNDWKINFHQPTVYQERNEHNLIKDLQDEIPGYVNNQKIVSILENLQLQRGLDNITNNLLLCYEALIKNNFIGENEMGILADWIQDLQELNFK